MISSPSINIISNHFRFIYTTRKGHCFALRRNCNYKDNSKIFIKEYVFKDNERKYAYNWTDASGNLICRWDNASHWPDISTFPHHKHIDNGVQESTETSFSDVLESVIQKRFKS